MAGAVTGARPNVAPARPGGAATGTSPATRPPADGAPPGNPGTPPAPATPAQDGGLTVADLPALAVAAPGATPDGAEHYLSDDSNTAEAWLGDGEDGQQAGFLRAISDPQRAVRIDDVNAWAEIVDSLGLTERPNPQGVPTPTTADTSQQAPGPAQEGTLGTQAERKAAPTDGVTTPSDYEEQNGVMVALIIPEGDAADIALDLPTAEDPTNLHITLCYLGTTDEVGDVGEFYSKVLDALRDAASEYAPVSGMVSGVGRFSIDGGEDAFVYLVDSPELADLRQEVVEELEDEGIDVSHDHGFTPHITVAYLKQGEDNPIRRAETKVLTFDELTFCFGDQRLPIKLTGDGSGDDEADEADVAMLTPYGVPDTTAPSAIPGGKAKPMPPQFARGKNGKNRAKRPGGPPIATGSWVSWGNQRGRVDLVVTNGKVPGVEEDVTGTANSPAARVVVYSQGDGGKWTATGKKIGITASGLKRSFPLTGGNFGKKDLDVTDPDAALVDVLTGYYETVDETKDLPLVDPTAVRTVYERGMESWPGQDVAGVPAEQWALGRTKAFLTVAAGRDVPGYEADRDLLPEGHPVLGGGFQVVDPTDVADAEQAEGKAADHGERVDADTVRSVIEDLRRPLTEG